MFLSVGTQLPFDRLVQYAVDFVSARGDVQLVAQVGFESKFLYQKCANVDFRASVSRVQYDDLVSRATVFVSHCGTGSIMAALGKRGAFLAVPRRASLGEHRNDHQFDTAKSIESVVQIATNMEEFTVKMESLFSLSSNDQTVSEELVNHRFVKSLDDEVKRLLLL